MKRVALILGLSAAPVAAEDMSFVDANILGIFYHELGHAVIDIEGVPIFAQVEDAADDFSTLMIDALWENEAAEALSFQAANGFWAEAAWREETGEAIEWSDVHSPDERRYFNTICLFYGANPDERDDFADDLGLPDARVESCVEEFELANESWGPVIDDMIERGPGETLRFSGSSDTLIGRLVAEEVEALNKEMSLAQPIDILLEHCGEANAFYDPNAISITMCIEFEDHLIDIEDLL